MDNIKSIRTRCDVMLAAANVTGDKERINKLIEVQNFLNNDNCFVNADEMKCTYYLLRLGYDFDQASEIYGYYNKVQVFSGVLEYTDGNGNIIQKEAVLSPDYEEYYKFKNGPIFKFDSKKNDFYMLINGKWVYDGDLQRKFYDSGYSYERIKYRIDEKKTARR